MSVVLLLQKSSKIEYLYIFWSEDREWFCFESFLRFLMFDDIINPSTSFGMLNFFFFLIFLLIKRKKKANQSRVATCQWNPRIVQARGACDV